MEIKIYILRISSFILIFVHFCNNQTLANMDCYIKGNSILCADECFHNVTDFSAISEATKAVRITCDFSSYAIRTNELLKYSDRFAKLKIKYCLSFRSVQEFLANLQNLEQLNLSSAQFTKINSTKEFFVFPKSRETTFNEFSRGENPSCSCPHLKHLTIHTHLTRNTINLHCGNNGNNNTCCSTLDSITVINRFKRNEIFRGLFNSKHVHVEIATMKFHDEAFSSIFVDLHNLTNVKLNRNSLYFLPENLSYPFENLQSLDLSNNKLTAEALNQVNPLKSVENLNLCFNKIKSLDYEFQKFPSLETLKLCENKIMYISSNSFKNCLNLVSIDLSENSIFALIDTYESGNVSNVFDSINLPKLQYLNLENNEIRQIDCSLIPKTVTKLNINKNPVSSFTYNEASCSVHMLKQLYADKTALSNLEDSSFPPSVEIISLKHTKISRLPANTFSTLKNLKELHLDRNELIVVDRHAFTSSSGSRSVVNFFMGSELLFPCCKKSLRENKIQNYCMQRQSLIQIIRMVPLRDDKMTRVCQYVKTCSDEKCDLCEKYKLETSGSDHNGKTNAILDCGNLTLTEVPLILPNDSIEIYLDDNNLTTVVLNEILGNYSNTEVLYLNKSQVRRVKINVECLSLRELHLEDNYLESFPSEFLDKLKNLTSLYLQNNLFLHFEIVFNQELILNKLHLEQNRISEFVVVHGSPVNERIMDVQLQFNNISTINSSFCSYKIQSLNLKGNNICEVNLNCTHEMVLEKLFLQDNHLTVLQSRAFSNLQNLQELHLEGNGIRHIEQRAFYFLHELKELYLQKNKISYIQKKMFYKIKELRVLHLEENNIVNVSVKSFKKFKDLLELYLNENELTTLPPGLFEKNKKIKELHLEGNLIVRISMYIFHDLLSLVSLYLNKNYLREIIPFESLYLPDLVELHLEDNQLTALNGNEFKGLSELKKLFLHRNKIHFINKDTFKEMTSLTVLTLHDNKLKRPEIWNFRLSEGINVLTIYDNPVSCECGYLEELRNSLMQVNFSGSLSEVTCISKKNAKYIIEEYLIQFCQRKDLIIGLSVSIGILLLLVSISILLYRYRLELQVIIYSRFNFRFFSNELVEDEKLFHAFISYSSDDVEFVARQLVPGLDNYRLCIHDRDFVVGAFIQDNITSAINYSCCTLIVLSKNFAKSEWCKFEFRTAHQKSLSDRCRRLFVIVLEDVEPHDLDEEMKVYLKTVTYLRWGDNLFWEKLYFVLPSLNRKDTIRDKQNKLPIQYFKS